MQSFLCLSEKNISFMNETKLVFLLKIQLNVQFSIFALASTELQLVENQQARDQNPPNTGQQIVGKNSPDANQQPKCYDLPCTCQQPTGHFPSYVQLHLYDSVAYITEVELCMGVGEDQGVVGQERMKIPTKTNEVLKKQHIGDYGTEVISDNRVCSPYCGPNCQTLPIFITCYR